MLNENIKNLRKSKGLSQEELAIKLNVIRQTVSKWENGLSVPDSDMLIFICQRSMNISDDFIQVPQKLFPFFNDP